MLYKTITLQLLQDHPPIYDRLLNERRLLPALEHYTTELKNLHETWKERLEKARPGNSDHQTSSEALELALQDLKQDLSSASAQDESEMPSLDAAMAFLARHTLPA